MASTDRLPISAPAVAALAAVALLSGCSVTGPRTSPLPQGGQTIAQVYKEHMRTEGFGAGAADPRQGLQEPGAAARRARNADDAGQGLQDRRAGLLAAGYASQIQPMQQRFQRLPNPDLVMYVHPHLAKGRYPVPGYLTVFPLYEAVEYALPGEVGPARGAMTDVPAMRNALGAEFDLAAEPEAKTQAMPEVKPATTRGAPGLSSRPAARASSESKLADAR